MLTMQSMKFHILVWKICGVWPDTQSQQIWYPFYAILFFGIIFIIFPVCMILNLIWVDNLNQVVETLLICSTCVLASLKGFFVLLKQSKLRELFAIINEMDMHVKTDVQKDIIKVAIKECRTLIFVASGLYYGGVNSAFILSFLGSERALMWPSWYPCIHYENSTVIFFTLAIYQYVASLFVALMDSSVDIYGSALNKMLGAHLDILGIQLKNLGIEPDKNTQIKNGTKQLDVLQNKWERELSECADYHNLCIK